MDINRAKTINPVVYVLTTTFSSGKKEINGIYSSREKAEEMKHWLNTQCKSIIGDTDYDRAVSYQQVTEHLVL